MPCEDWNVSVSAGYQVPAKPSSPALPAILHSQTPRNTYSVTSPWKSLKETEMGKTALTSVYNLEAGSKANTGDIDG